jgi:multidrug resistance protein
MRYIWPPRSSQRISLAVVTFATFTDMLLYGIVVPVLPDYAEGLGISEWSIGVLFGAYSAALLVATPYFGALSDRVGRRRPMLWGLLGLAAATVLFAFATTYWMLLAARLLQGVAAAATWTAGLALIADVFPGQARGAALGTAMAGMTAGMLIGPPFGGLLYEWGGYRAPFLVAAAVVVVQGVALLFLVKDPPRLLHEEGSIRKLLRDRGMQVAAGATVVAAAAWGLLEPVLPLHLEREFDFSPGAVGLLFGAATLVYGVCAPLIGALSDRWDGRRVMTVGVVLLAVSLPLIGLPDALVIVVLALMAVSIAYGFLLTPALPEMASVVDRRGGGYASAYAVFNTAYAAGMMAGPVIGGALVSTLGFGTALLVTGALVLAYLPVLRRHASVDVSSYTSHALAGGEDPER